MTSPGIPTSFPYLSVAKQYGVDYWRVLKFADLLEKSPPKQEDWALPRIWMVATCLAFKHEQGRRMESGQGAIVTVYGDCGVIHGNVEEWPICDVGASILKSKLRTDK
jgi:hypothetical protein